MPEDDWVPAWVSVQVIPTTSKLGVPEDGRVQACQPTLGIVDRDLAHCRAEDMGKSVRQQSERTCYRRLPYLYGRELWEDLRICACGDLIDDWGLSED